MLPQLKDFLRAQLGVYPDVIIVVAGLACFLITCLVARRPLAWAWALVPGICLALAVEAWEIWQHYGARGLTAASVRELAGIIWRHARDVLVMNLAPAVVVVVASLSRRIG